MNALAQDFQAGQINEAIYVFVYWRFGFSERTKIIN